MKTTLDDVLFVGTYGHVRALHKLSGEKIWTRSLPDTGYSIVTLLYEDDVLYAGSKGYLFALDPYDGSILWKNNLKGLGHGHMMLLTLKSSANPGLDVAEMEEEGQRASNSS